MNETMTVGELYEAVNSGRIVSDIELQREIVYNDDKQRLVIDSLALGVPLPAFYLWERENGTREVLDGKQRIHAICRWRENDLLYKSLLYKQTPKELQDAINGTVLSVIVCSGDDALKREIFNRINTLGVPLSPYEVLNGLYHGEYLRGLTAYVSQDKYAVRVLGGNSRGKNQMRVLKWLLVMGGAKPSAEAIHEYVKARRDDSFQDDQIAMSKPLRFVGEVFTDYGLADIFISLALKYQKDMAIWKSHKTDINRQIARFKKSDAWKLLPNKPQEIEDIVQAVVGDISVDPRRLFTEDQKQELLRMAEDAGDADGGRYRCAICGQLFYPDELTCDHVIPWSKGGRTEVSNGQLLCTPCNSKKGNRR